MQHRHPITTEEVYAMLFDSLLMSFSIWHFYFYTACCCFNIFWWLFWSRQGEDFEQRGFSLKSPKWPFFMLDSERQCQRDFDSHGHQSQVLSWSPAAPALRQSRYEPSWDFQLYVMKAVKSMCPPWEIVVMNTEGSNYQKKCWNKKSY